VPAIRAKGLEKQTQPKNGEHLDPEANGSTGKTGLPGQAEHINLNNADDIMTDITRQ
jgi:hypothetical protein